jgi:hypothetical protein
MLQKCANPACSAPFRSLREGKLFLAETLPQDSSRSFGGERRKVRKREHFWLCDACANHFTLRFDAERGMLTVPLTDYMAPMFLTRAAGRGVEVGKTAFTDPSLPTHFPCAVCGIESNQRASWFLVVENRWLDRIRILSWHPVLAAQDDMLGVCGWQHLKTLISHWLTEADLEFQADRDHAVPITSGNQTPTELGPLALSWLVGELAVHRDTLSRAWTGSPETMACIMNALIGEVEPRSPDTNFSVFDVSSDYFHEIAVH